MTKFTIAMLSKIPDYFDVDNAGYYLVYVGSYFDGEYDLYYSSYFESSILVDVPTKILISMLRGIKYL